MEKLRVRTTNRRKHLTLARSSEHVVQFYDPRGQASGNAYEDPRMGRMVAMYDVHWFKTFDDDGHGLRLDETWSIDGDALAQARRWLRQQ